MNQTVEFKPDLKYTYATGRIRVLETKLLSSSKVEKMINSRSISDVLIYLEDTAYDDTIGEMKDPGKYGEFVKIERLISFDLMERLIYDSEVKQLFRIQFDFHNIKILLKKRLSGTETSDILSDFGTVPVTDVKTAFETENFNPLPDFMKETIGEALAYHYIKKSLKSMEFLIDKLEYKHHLLLSQKTGIPFLINYIKMKIDLINISTLLRIKYFDTKDNIEDVLIDGGNLSISFFLLLMGESLEMLPSSFRNNPYCSLLEVGIKKITEKSSFSVFDRECENFIMRYMKLTRYITFGVEPVVAYFVSREQDINILKMILVGKINEIPTEEIKQRIPITFN